MTAIATATQVHNVPAEFFQNEFLAIRAQLDNLSKQVAPKQPQDEYLTRNEVASLLKVTVTTIWNWSQPTGAAQIRILQPYRIGNQVRYLKSEVLASAKAVIATGKESRKNG